MTNSELLKEEIQNSGFKIRKIAEMIGVSHNTFYGKMYNLRSFTTVEAKAVCGILKITDPTRIIAIFFA